MKNKRITILLIITNIILIGIICSLISKNVNIIKEKQIIKEMNESTQVTELNNQINALNIEHTEYMNYIQTCKTKIATALTNEGVTTSDQSTLETMAESISKVLKERTKDATATAANITKGKTAYINGKLVTGTGEDNNYYYEQGKEENTFDGDTILYRNGFTTSGNACKLSVKEENDLQYECSIYGHKGTYNYNFTAINMQSLTVSIGSYCSSVRVLITNYLDNSTVLDVNLTSGQSIDLSEATKCTNNVIPLLSLIFTSNGSANGQDTYITATFIK